MRPCSGGSMARNDIVRCACGPDAAGSSDTPWADENAHVVAEALHHVGVAGQRPEAGLVVAVDRRLVAQPGVGRVRVLVDLVGVRAVGQRAHGCVPQQHARRPRHAVGQLGVGEVAHARPGAARRPAPGRGPAARPGRRRRRAPRASRPLNAAPMRSRRRSHVGVAGQHRGGRRGGQLGLVGHEQRRSRGSAADTRSTAAPAPSTCGVRERRRAGARTPRRRGGPSRRSTCTRSPPPRRPAGPRCGRSAPRSRRPAAPRRWPRPARRPGRPGGPPSPGGPPPRSTCWTCVWTVV